MYVAPVDTVIEGVVSVVDQTKFVPEVVNVDVPHPSTTVTIGVDGIAVGAATPDPGKLVQPATVCVTVNVPPVDTVIDGVVSVVDQTKFVPEVVNVDVPQPSTTVTTGVAGIPGSTNDSDTVFDPHPSLNVTS